MDLNIEENTLKHISEGIEYYLPYCPVYKPRHSDP